MIERRTSHESPVDLIDSGQFLTAEEQFAERRTDDPMEMVVRSEVATYFGRFSDGAALLEQVGPRVSEIDVAARYSLAKGRLALFRGDHQQAEAQLQTAFHFYRFLNDSFGLSQSLLGLAHLARSRGDLALAATMLADALEGIKGRTSKKVEFLRGIIAVAQAGVASDRGEIEQATEQYSEATRLLKGNERGRFYARSLVGMADLRCALGDFAESIELYKEANTVFERYDLKAELAESQLKLGEALTRLRRFERAEKLADDSRDLQRGDPAGESAALTLMAQVSLLQSELDEARTRAISAVELADQGNVLHSRVRARVILGRVRTAEREFKHATEVLREAAELARGSSPSVENQKLELEAVVYLAEAYHNECETRTDNTTPR